MARDHKGVRQGQRDLAAGGAGQIDRAAHRGARFFRIPEIAFEIEDRGTLDQFGVDQLRGQKLRRTKEGVHRALRIGRHQNQAARGRRLAGAGGHGEIDAGGANVMREHLTQLIVGNLTNKGGLVAKAGKPCQRVRRAAAADLAAGAHRII